MTTPTGTVGRASVRRNNFDLIRLVAASQVVLFPGLEHLGPAGATHSVFGEALSWFPCRTSIPRPSPNTSAIARCGFSRRSGRGEVVIVFNGEIYNFAELRSELRARGRTFRSTSDTEVLPNGYLEFGVAVVDRLNGIFALCRSMRRPAWIIE